MKRLLFILLMISGIAAIGQPGFCEIGLAIRDTSQNMLRISLYPTLSDKARCDVYSFQITEQCFYQLFLCKPEEEYPADTFVFVEEKRLDDVCNAIGKLTPTSVITPACAYSADDCFFIELTISSGGESFSFNFRMSLDKLLQDDSDLCQICRQILTLKDSNINWILNYLHVETQTGD